MPLQAEEAMESNIFQKACLIQLEISCWQGSRMLDAGIMERLGNSEWLRGRKYLVNPETLNPIRAAISRARKYLQKSALPFPITGLTLVPKDALSRVDTGLRGIQEEFQGEVSAFVEAYEDARREAALQLGEFFSEADYPVDIHTRFRFEWRFLTLDVPGKSGILSPEIYEREKNKFTAMMEETRQLAVVALREEFAGIVSHLAERLSGNDDGSPKKFKDCMVQKMHDFLDSFSSRNLFDDQGLAELVAAARSMVGGLSPEDLRQDLRLRESIAGEMHRIKSVMDESMVALLPRRKIRLAA
jgi:hypothetical protein